MPSPDTSSGAYEFVSPTGFPPAAAGNKGGKSNNAEDDVFSGSNIDATYGEYNDVKYIEGKRSLVHAAHPSSVDIFEHM